MGKVFSLARHKITKSANRFNVENRAHKIISQDKPKPAPKHEASIREMEIMKREYGEVFEELQKKHVQLDEHLRHVFVVSKDPEPLNRFYGKPSEKMRLPSNRVSSVDSELGYFEPLEVPEGKITLKQAMEILTVNQADPKTYNAPVISKQYKLSMVHTENMLEYFKNFNVHISDKSKVTKAEVNLPKTESLPLQGEKKVVE